MRGLLLTTTMLCALPGIAFAQESVDTADTPEAASGEEGLGEIVVTAQRREESSQKAAVPLSVGSAGANFENDNET